MLVGGGVEDIIRTEGAENVFHTGASVHAGNYHLAGDIREILGHHQANVMLRGFGLVQKHHLLRFELRHLLHDFQADGTGRTRDKDAFTGKEFPDGLHVHADFRAGQEVFHTHLPQLHTFNFFVGEGAVFHAGFLGLMRHEDLAACSDDDILDLLVLAELVHAERAHENGLNALFL